MKKRYQTLLKIFVFFLSLIIISKIVYSGCGCDEYGCEGDCTPSERFDWGHTEDFTDDDWAALKAEDLKGKLDQVPDLSKLNGEEARKAFDEYAPKTHLTDLDLPPGTTFDEESGILTMPDGTTVNLKELEGEHSIETKDGKLYIDGKEVKGAKVVKSTGDGGLQMDSVETYNDGSVYITNGVNVKIYDDFITADYADSFVTDSSITTIIDNLEVNPTTFYVKKADSVVSSCVTISNLEDSTLKIYSNAIEVSVGKDVSLDIEDCSYNKVVFDGSNAKVIVSKEVPPTYQIENGTLTGKNDKATEKIEAENSITIELDPIFGFSCMKINPPGVYWYHENLIKDFGIHVPAESDEYMLCLRKHVTQGFNNYDGIVDFADKNIKLNKIVNYLRYPFENDKILSLIMDKVYEGKDKNNELIMSLDNDFVFIDDFLLKNKNPGNTISVTRSGYHEITEIPGTRFEKIHIDKFYPDTIRKYKTEFFVTVDTIDEKTLTQTGNTKVKILSVNTNPVKEAESFLAGYWQRIKKLLLIEYLV